MKKLLFIALITVGLALSANSQKKIEINKDISNRIDTLLAKQFKADEPGCAVLISQGDKVIYKKAFGMGDIELNVPMNPDMVFEIGSIGKQFTAVAIMQLVEQGKIALDDPFNKYIKDFPTPNYKITIEHLLTHTSGLTDIFKIEGFGTNFWRQDYTKQEYLEFLKKGKVEFTPGTKFSYCNTGYILLGYIIEEVSGLTYQQYIKENIFKKAQLANSYNGTYHKIIKNRASGYGISETDGSIENLERVSWTIIGGAGSLMCNTEDFFKYYRALDTYKLISKKSLERTRTNYKLADGKESGYGFGIGVGKSKDRPVVSHTGGITGYFTSQMYFPDEEVHIIIFTNCEGYMSKDPVWKISEIIFEGVL